MPCIWRIWWGVRTVLWGNQHRTSSTGNLEWLTSKLLERVRCVGRVRVPLALLTQRCVPWYIMIYIYVYIYICVCDASCLCALEVHLRSRKCCLEVYRVIWKYHLLNLLFADLFLFEILTTELFAEVARTLLAILRSCVWRFYFNHQFYLWFIWMWFCEAISIPTALLAMCYGFYPQQLFHWTFLG